MLNYTSPFQIVKLQANLGTGVSRTKKKSSGDSPPPTGAIHNNGRQELHSQRWRAPGAPSGETQPPSSHPGLRHPWKTQPDTCVGQTHEHLYQDPPHCPGITTHLPVNRGPGWSQGEGESTVKPARLPSNCSHRMPSVACVATPTGT